jgi:hypothetical protein
LNLKALDNKRSDIDIGISISSCDDPHGKTTIIRFSERFTVLNKLQYPIVFKQLDPDISTYIGDNESVALEIALKSEKDESKQYA